MSRRAGLVAGLVVLAAVAVWAWTKAPAPQGAVADAPVSGIERHAFLDGLTLDGGAGYALMLHDQVTGDGLRVVRDMAALRAAQGTAYYTDSPGAMLKQTLLSILFVSPPGMPPSNAFVTVLKDKAVATTYTCFRRFCQGDGDFDPAHERDMAGLLEASEPVELVTETFDHHDKARAEMWQLMQDPDVVRIEPPDLPAPGTLVFPARVRLSLPAILLETDESGYQPVGPFDKAALEARFVAAFTHAFPETEAYRLGPMRESTYFAPQNGWPIVSDEIEGYLRGADGQLRGLKRIMVIELYLTVDVTPRIAAALRGPEAFAEMPEFLPPEPASVADRLAAMAKAHLGRPCPECFEIELPVATVDGIRVDDLDPPSFPLTWYRIAGP